MPIPDNTTPMMGGTGQFGALDMGGMFSVIKVRKDQARGDYRDPGWYAQPAGTGAFEFTGALSEPARFQSERGAGAATGQKPVTEIELQVRRPGAHVGH